MAQYKDYSVTAPQIANFLHSIEIDSDPEHDQRKREQLSSAFAFLLFGGKNVETSNLHQKFFDEATRKI